jgi:hypothetical protein
VSVESACPLVDDGTPPVVDELSPLDVSAPVLTAPVSVAVTVTTPMLLLSTPDRWQAHMTMNAESLGRRTIYTPYMILPP